MVCVPVGRRERKVRGDGNCFYRAMALAVNGSTDRDFATIRAICTKRIADYPDVFIAYLFISKTVEEHLAIVPWIVRGQKLLIFFVVLLFFNILY